MEENTKMDLGPFVNEHPKLWDFCWKIYSIENFLKNDKFRYVYLTNIISSESIINKETAKESLNELNFIKQNINYFNITKEIKDEVKQFVKNGIDTIKQYLKKIKMAEL